MKIDIPYLAHPCESCNACGKVLKVNRGLMRHIRVNLGIGLREAARDIGISAQYLSDMELGKRNMSEKIAKSLIKLYERQKV